MKAILPVTTGILAVLVAAIPWGLPGDATFVLPLLVMATVFYWASQEDAWFAPWFAFVLGLFTDMLTAGPLGYWALMFLLGYTAGRLAPGRSGGAPVRLWGTFAFAVAVISLIGWALASLYYVRVIDWRPIVIGAVASAVLFPVVEMIFRGLNRLFAPRGRFRSLGA